MKNTLILGFILLQLIATAHAENTQQRLTACRSISDSRQRLTCYDEIEADAMRITDERADKDTDEQAEKDENISNSQSMPVLLADLQEPRLFASVGQLDFLGNQISSILLGVGARVKLKTFDYRDKPLDFNLISMINSQFDIDEIDTRNNRGGALINTDFMIGGELVKAFDFGYLRLRYAHKSTHLGDEFLLDNPEYLEQRLNLSYESLGLLAYRNMNHWGAYLGASAIVRSEPGSLDKLQLQSGLQYIGAKRNWYKPLFGIDLSSWQETNWHLNSSLKAGFEYTSFLDNPVQFMLEYYDGKSPYGQFFNEDLEFYGVSFNYYWQ